MSDPIRTPEDEITTPGTFYPPFHEDWWYQGATYGGHSDFSVDWNRRTRNGGWLDDRGDPVLAAADGTVSDIDGPTGTVWVNHYGGLWRTEYRHMGRVVVRVGDKVRRGDKLGEIGAEGIDPADIPGGGAPSPHLHHVHWKRDKLGESFERTKMRFLGDPVEASVGDSNSRPRTWDAPGPVMVQGPPPPATWESAFREAERVIARKEARILDLGTTLASRTLELSTANEQVISLNARINELAAQTPDCSVVEGERDALAGQLQSANEANSGLRTQLDERTALIARIHEETAPA